MKPEEKGKNVAASSDDNAQESAGKMGFSKDGDMFFGTSPVEKKSLRRTIDKRKIDPLKDLDLNAARRNAPPKVGRSARLIDFAMDDRDPSQDADNDPGSDDQLPVLPPFKKLDKNRQSRPGRETRAFAATAVGREFVTPDEAKRNPEPTNTGSRTRRLIVNCDFKQGKMPTRSLPRKSKPQRPGTPASGPQTMRRPRPGTGPRTPLNNNQPGPGPRAGNTPPRPIPKPGTVAPGRPGSRPGPGSHPVQGGRPPAPGAKPTGTPPRPTTRRTMSLSNRRLQKPGGPRPCGPTSPPPPRRPGPG